MDILTEEEKGKARVMAIMCGYPVPAGAIPNDDKEENTNEPDKDERR